MLIRFSVTLFDFGDVANSDVHETVTSDQSRAEVGPSLVHSGWSKRERERESAFVVFSTVIHGVVK